MDQNLYPLIIAAVIWTVYQAKIIKQSGTTEGNLRLLNNVLIHVMHPLVGSKGDGSTCGAQTTVIIM